MDDCVRVRDDLGEGRGQTLRNPAVGFTWEHTVHVEHVEWRVARLLLERERVAYRYQQQGPLEFCGVELVDDLPYGLGGVDFLAVDGCHDQQCWSILLSV